MPDSYVGNLPEFVPGEDEWSEYLERLDSYFVINSVTEDATKKNFLLNAIGGKTYHVLRNLLVPKKPKDATLTEITNAMSQHFEPKPSEIVQRYKFNSCYRKSEQSIAEYVARLQELGQHCNYGSTLSEMLRDRLVCGSNDDRIQRRLLAEPRLTFKQAFEIAVACENAAKNIATLQGNGSESSPVNRVASSTRPKSKLRCYRCLGQHIAPECPFIDKECFACHSIGHTRVACKKKKPDDANETKPAARPEKKFPSKRKPTEKPVRAVEVDEESGNEEEYPLYNVTDSTSSPIWISVSINQQASLSMEFDTGASVSLISAKTLENLNLSPPPKILPTRIKLSVPGGHRLKALGYCNVHVSCMGASADLQLYVSEEKCPSLFGRPWFYALRIPIQDVLPVYSVSTHYDEPIDKIKLNKLVD